MVREARLRWESGNQPDYACPDEVGEEAHLHGAARRDRPAEKNGEGARGDVTPTSAIWVTGGSWAMGRCVGRGVPLFGDREHGVGGGECTQARAPRTAAAQDHYSHG